MNALNIISARVIGPTPPPTPSAQRAISHEESPDQRSAYSAKRARPDAQGVEATISDEKSPVAPSKSTGDDDSHHDPSSVGGADEKTPLLSGPDVAAFDSTKPGAWRLVPKRVATALLASLKWVLSTILAPGVYLVAFFQNDAGEISFRSCRPGRHSTAQAMGISGSSGPSPGGRLSGLSRRQEHNSSASAIVTDSEPDTGPSTTSSQHTRSRSHASSSSDGEDTVGGTRRSIRIKLYSEDSPSKRRSKNAKTKSNNNAISPSANPASGTEVIPAAVAIKSPTSPASSSLRYTKYPRAPAPPRPLIPRRTSSYSYGATIPTGLTPAPQKTLILDLDETLIHSLAKGGRMSTGHMVEVKLSSPVGLSTSGGNAVTLAPQHPILYYVHKRPHCDDFLRKVHKWYNLVIFTASVQEYADPVIDWLEQDRKYFVGRYYRQHCTFRLGNYIKDISSVEPDLSKVMIVDNSPSSYVFHEDNAIPIEGWINDPTDNDLLHLVPILEGLQYVTDVRALLALRTGEFKG